MPTNHREIAIESHLLEHGYRSVPKSVYDRFIFERKLENLLIGRMDQNDGIFDRFMNDTKFRTAVVGAMMKVVYERARGGA